MKFWDASAIVPLLIAEAFSSRLRTLLSEDPAMLVWWGTSVECVSALARIERSREDVGVMVSLGFSRLAELTDSWQEIDPSDAIRHVATRFLRVHPLRTGDAFQLAAAFAASGGHSASLEFVTLDDRLATAARREGFAVPTP